jgi:branched-chain amino acid transport system permease protein
VVIWGFRSISGALFAGVMGALVPALFAQHLSKSANNLVPVLFGLTAIQLAREPRGLVAMNVQMGRDLVAFVRRRRSKIAGAPADLGMPTAATRPESDVVPADLRTAAVGASAFDSSEDGSPGE